MSNIDLNKYVFKTDEQMKMLHFIDNLVVIKYPRANLLCSQAVENRLAFSH